MNMSPSESLKSYSRAKLNIDSGQTFHKCSQCGYAGAQSSDLKNHKKIHSGEKLHKCDQCDYTSVQPGNLRRHLKRHLRNKKAEQANEGKI